MPAPPAIVATIRPVKTAKCAHKINVLHADPIQSVAPVKCVSKVLARKVTAKSTPTAKSLVRYAKATNVPRVRRTRNVEQESYVLTTSVSMGTVKKLRIARAV